MHTTVPTFSTGAYNRLSDGSVTSTFTDGEMRPYGRPSTPHTALLDPRPEFTCPLSSNCLGNHSSAKFEQTMRSCCLYLPKEGFGCKLEFLLCFRSLTKTLHDRVDVTMTPHPPGKSHHPDLFLEAIRLFFFPI